MRTLLEMKELVKNGNGGYCCVKQPLLNIDLDHVIVDELHLLLRVMDVMLDNIITEVIDWDKSDDFEKSAKEPRGIHLKKRSDPVVWVLVFGKSAIQLTIKALESMNLQVCLEMTRRKSSPCYQKISAKCCSQIPARNIQGVG